MMEAVNFEIKNIEQDTDDKFYYNEEEVYEAFAKTSKELIVIGNLKTGYFKYPLEIASLLGLSSQVVKNPMDYWKKIIIEEDWDKFYKSNEEFMSGRATSHHVDFKVNVKNKIIWLNCVGNMIKDKDGNPSTFVGIISVHEKNSKIDSVTKLFVIEEFFSSLSKKLKNSPENLGVVILGINNFKRINEFYGREIGDKILRKMAMIIQNTLPSTGEVYKLDGTNFGIILENTSKEQITFIYETVRDLFNEKQILSKYEDILSISAGVTLYPTDGKNCQELYQHSKYARGYSKKSQVDSLVFFSKELFHSRERYLKILSLLKRDIDHNFENFNILFQPQVEAKTQAIQGVEALLRWKCEEFGNVSPLEFIPILEENNLMGIVGRWVLEKSLEIYKNNWSKYRPKFSISVNVSFVQFLEKDFIENIKYILDKSQVNPENLVLELTESSMVTNVSHMKKIYETLKTLGVKIALDDFGTGYSSLGILKELPIDIIKTDRVFIKNILQDSFNLMFIKFITVICHQVNLEVCIEGIEEKEEYDLINGLGVDYIQGYYFGKPLPKEEITEKIKI